MADQALPGDGSLEDHIRAIDRYAKLGAERIVVSAADRPTLARFGDRRLRARPPQLEVADPRGAGDAMTAGLVIAALRRLDPERALQIACAAGAANVTRRGLGSADAALVESLANHVQIEDLGSSPGSEG